MTLQRCPRSLKEKQKIDFQDGHYEGHLGFLIQMILAIFDQVLSQLACRFRRRSEK